MPKRQIQGTVIKKAGDKTATLEVTTDGAITITWA